jgi:hypothetical protein
VSSDGRTVKPEGSCFVTRSPARTTLSAVVLAVVVACAANQSAHAQGRLDANYTATLSGIPIGKGSWTIDVDDDQFSATASGATSGLLRVFASGQGNSAAHGSMTGGQPMPSTYTSTIVADNKADQVRILFSGGNVKEYLTDPPTTPSPERVPITEANRKNVFDPMTASLMRVSGNGDTFAPEACQRTIPVFDGRMRYDLRLAYKRVDHVKAEKGYQGPVLVCSVFFSPIAGHIPTRAAIKYLAEQHDMEVWLAPITGTHVLVPYRMQAPTPIGPAVLEATHFVTMAQPARPTSASAKTQ